MAVTVQAPAAPAGPVLETAVEGGTATGICTILGILDWRRSKLRAYRWFERGALIAILIGEFFSFYQYQVAAIFGLVWMIVQLGVIRSMIGAEVANAATRLEESAYGGA